jgi:hypothetical protein
MKSLVTRITAAIVALVTVVLLAGAAAKSANLIEPDKRVILSPVDVKGKTSPCG